MHISRISNVLSRSVPSAVCLRKIAVSCNKLSSSSFLNMAEAPERYTYADFARLPKESGTSHRVRLAMFSGATFLSMFVFAVLAIVEMQRNNYFNEFLLTWFYSVVTGGFLLVWTLYEIGLAVGTYKTKAATAPDNPEATRATRIALLVAWLVFAVCETFVWYIYIVPGNNGTNLDAVIGTAHYEILHNMYMVWAGMGIYTLHYLMTTPMYYYYITADMKRMNPGMSLVYRGEMEPGVDPFEAAELQRQTPGEGPEMALVAARAHGGKRL